MQADLDLSVILWYLSDVVISGASATMALDDRQQVVGLGSEAVNHEEFLRIKW